MGIYRNGLWVLDTQYTGMFVQPAPGYAESSGSSAVFSFGGLAGGGDVPVAGNWYGGLAAHAGYVRSSGGPGGPWLWVTDQGAANATFQSAHVQNTGFAFGGLTGDVPVVGDWYDTGTAQAGFVRTAGGPGGPWLWITDQAGPLAPQAGHGNGIVFPYGGLGGDIPVTGKWYIPVN